MYKAINLRQRRVKVYHRIAKKASQGLNFSGNGKIDHTPSPVSLRKIKRVSFKVFYALKELVNSVKVTDSITPRGNRKKSVFRRKRRRPRVPIQNRAYEYEPSTAIRLFNSPSWQWHRANEWDRYINNEE